MAIGKSIVDVLRSITGKKVDTIADGLEEALSGGSGGGGAFIVTASWDEQTGNGTLNKTWQEIHDAALTSVVIWVIAEEGYLDIAYLKGIADVENTYTLAFCALGDSVIMNEFVAESASDYPVIHQGD